MGALIQFEPEGAVQGGALAPATPLAGVACCQEIPDYHGDLEPSSEPQLHRGQILDGRFIIREVVARSGQATVYQAVDMLNGRREVAIKVPLRKMECDVAAFSRFKHEEEIGLRLAHPGLLKFFAVTEGRSRPYLVTEYLHGCTLGHLAHHRRPIAEADALKIVALVADAVGHMHGRGIIHCDLKPTNLMICCDRTLRVLDFGLSAAPMRTRSVLARLGNIFGAPEYMAPEQVENGPIDERTDIYALGCVLYELLTGSVPFAHENQWQSAFQRTSGDPVAPRKLNPALSPQAEETESRRPVCQHGGVSGRAQGAGPGGGARPVRTPAAAAVQAEPAWDTHGGGPVNGLWHPAFARGGLFVSDFPPAASPLDARSPHQAPSLAQATAAGEGPRTRPQEPIPTSRSF